jgi:hypothetical protein
MTLVCIGADIVGSSNSILSLPDVLPTVALTDLAGWSILACVAPAPRAQLPILRPCGNLVYPPRILAKWRSELVIHGKAVTYGQPCSIACRAYQERSLRALTASRRRTLWPQGNSATSCCTNSPSGQA